MNDDTLLDELTKLAAYKIGLCIQDNALGRFFRVLREHAARRDTTLADYRAFLVGPQAAGEWEELARAFTSSETYFFRDHGQFGLLRMHLLPELIARHRGDKNLRLWSAGCSSGEEAYSLAMLVDMLLPEREGWNILILGTDINSAAVDKARRGRYGQNSFRMVLPALWQRYFHLEGNEWILDERIRSMVTFRVSNLVSEPFPHPVSELHDMDLTLCRNVFIYFAPAAVSAVTAKFAATLREGGYLLTAHTELIGHSLQELESRLFAEGVVYQRQVPVPHPLPSIPAQTREGRVASKLPQSVVPVQALPLEPIPVVHNGDASLKEAHALADRGEYEQAEQVCRKILSMAPLAAAPYFLLAQLAQLRGNFGQAMELLNKALYLDPRFVAAHLELAALYERAEDLPRAQTLRHAALGIVRAMPENEQIEQYESTAGDLAQWLAQ
jgi:chemotaxis protein methyltransferase CheR